MRDDRAFWDAQYSRRHHAHGPNETLVEFATELAPGVALDLGCGEGHDARWLAARGWGVTGVDVSPAALARAQETPSTVHWLEADLDAWEPPRETFDLVTSHFVHVRPDARRDFFAKLVGAVRPGGRVLFVAHHHSDHGTTVGRPALPELFFTADELHAFLPAREWTLTFSGTRPRQTRDRAGALITLHDTVLQATRQPRP